MRVADRYVDEFFDVGFTLVPAFLDESELVAAQAALWSVFPTPTDYFADPAQFEWLRRGQFAGLREFPFAHFDLNALVVHDDLADFARRLIGTDEVRLYKGELWAKYGDVDYEQPHHRDYGNHTLVVPRADGRWRQITTFIYLNDVTEANGATAIVSPRLTGEIPLGVRRVGAGELRDTEQRLCGAAGSLVVYSTDVFHRGTAFTDPTATRFMVLADFRAADAPWAQKQAFGNHGNRAEMVEFVTRATPAQRTLLDIPAPGHEFWNDQTIRDMGLRYPGIDMTPYAIRSGV